MKRRILSLLVAWALVLSAVSPALAGAEEAGFDAPAGESGGRLELIVELEGEPLLLAGQAQRERLEEEQDSLLEQIRALDGGGQTELSGRCVMTLNALVLRAPASLKEKIEALDGVERVTTAALFEAPEELSMGRTESFGSGAAGVMAGVEDAFEQGLDGSGVVIAVLDSGLDLDHPAFSARNMDEDAVKLGLDEVSSAMSGLNAQRYRKGLTARQVWHSAKVPFAFNYAGHSADVSHGQDVSDDHGTHVAAIAAGVQTEECAAGAAPGAQLLVMKVFGDDGNTTSEGVLLAALEDAASLGADVVNLSLGTVWGFSDDGRQPYVKALETLAKAGAVVCAAAGNEYSSAHGNNSGLDLSSAGNVDTGVVSKPGALDGVLSVTSVNNAKIFADGFYVDMGGGKKSFVPMGDTGKNFGIRSFKDLLDVEGHRNGAYEYAVVPGLGAEEDFKRVDVKGRIALIQRGELSFAEKCNRAFAKGALAAVIWNNAADTVSMDLSGVEKGNDIPCVIVSREDGERMLQAAGSDGVGALTVLPGLTLADAQDGWEPSAFASWGPLSDLSLKPDVAGVGGNVYAAVNDGSYATRSGTSMSTPQASGMAALLLQYLRENRGLTGTKARERAMTLLLNTAVPMRQEDAVEYSPRKQGAGLANVGRAVSTPVWLTVDGAALPKAELGDDKNQTGVYEFSFTAHNDSKHPQSYAIHASVLTAMAGDGMMLQQERQAEAQTAFSAFPGQIDVREDAALLTVPAQGTVCVHVTVRLSAAERTRLQREFKNGIYMEGFVYLDSADRTAPDLSIPMLAFYGDWGSAPLFERVSAADLDAAAVSDTGNCPVPFEIITGRGSYLGENPIAQDDVYVPERSNALNTSGGDGGVVSNVILDLHRNARSVTVEMVSSQNKVLYSTSAHYMVKSCIQGEDGEMLPAVFSQYASIRFKPSWYGLRDGSTFTIRITGEKDADGVNAIETMELPAYVDGTAPVIQDAHLKTSDGRTILTVTVRDNFYTAGLKVVGSGRDNEKVWPVNQKTRGEAVTLQLDVTQQAAGGGTLSIGAMDYAQNMSACHIEL